MPKQPIIRTKREVLAMLAQAEALAARQTTEDNFVVASACVATLKWVLSGEPKRRVPVDESAENAAADALRASGLIAYRLGRSLWTVKRNKGDIGGMLSGEELIQRAAVATGERDGAATFPVKQSGGGDG